MATVIEGTVPDVEVGVDRYELERAIHEAFVAALGAEEVRDVHVSQFPYEYGAIVLLRHEPSAEAEALALKQEERFRMAGIRVGILVRKARRSTTGR
ncbi:MAG: hypothetical protein A2Z04_01590 [Chloroflexi bacterium RBG_16_57_9]|nr:MAG: hypothetical protein A2Z04_01590 [Chloroflexi bacterium RBG_16_57_9]